MPVAGDTVVIDVNGDYTVGLGSDVTVDRLIIGGVGGTQTLDTGAHSLTLLAGTVSTGAALQVDGSLSVAGQVSWTGGTFTGDGTVTIQAGSELSLDSSDATLYCSVDVLNLGVFALESDTEFRMDGATLTNQAGALIDMRGDGLIWPTPSGACASSGAIRKSGGTGEGSIVGANDAFVSTGTIDVQSGTLRTTATIGGAVQVDSDAVLRFTGTSTVDGNTLVAGDGPVAIDGTVAIGTLTGQTVSFGHLILDSGTLSGSAHIAVNDSLVWQRDTASGEGDLIVAEGASARFVADSARKHLIGRALRVRGTLTSGQSLNLRLDDDASIVVESTGQWNLGLGGTVDEAFDADTSILVEGSLTKTDGTLTTLTPDFVCSGLMLLNDGVVRFDGEFELTDNGILRGGGVVPASGSNIRLNLSFAEFPMIAGTIDPDLNGASAWLDITGALTLDTTPVINIDLDGGDPIRAERVSFTAGMSLNGHLALDRTFTPEAMETFRVVSIIDATGTMSVSGDTGFTVLQNNTGVNLTWDP